MKIATKASNASESRAGFKPKWPAGFERIPKEDWTKRPIDKLTLKYENAGTNGFCRNWDPAIAQVLTNLDENKILVDYSSGTGLFTQHLLDGIDYPTRILNVDISPRYLRVAADKFRDDERVALRLLKRIDKGDRVQSIDEVMGDTLLNRGVDMLTSTNAIHLYPNVSETLESWHRVLRPNGLVLVTSGDIDNPRRVRKDWRLHDTIARVNEIAQEVVESEPLFEEYRETLENREVMNAYTLLRQSVYPPSKPLDLYIDLLSDAGFKPLHYFEQVIDVSVNEMSDALLPYHDVILGWVGGSEKVEGWSPSNSALRDRIFLIKLSVKELYGTQHYLRCPWTYITCKRRRDGR